MLRGSATHITTVVLPALIKMMLTLQTSIKLQIAAPHGTWRVSLGVGPIASYQPSQLDKAAWTAILQPLL